MTAQLYQDQDYGTLTVIDMSEGIVTIDHSFDGDAFDAVLTVLERHSDVAAKHLGEGAALWRTTSHRQVVLASLETCLESLGYSNDPLAQRSVRAVDSITARATQPPPALGTPIQVGEAVRRGIQAHINMGLAVLRDRGDMQEAVVTHSPRSATDVFGRPLPLTRALGILSRPVESVDSVRSALREALASAGEALVRASVEDIGGRYAVEIALAPSRALVEEYTHAKTPTFEDSSTIRGVRPVRFVLNGMVSAADIASLEERAVISTAATSIAVPNSRTIVARIPSAQIDGLSASDNAFQKRVAWLAEQLGEWDPALDYIGGVEPVVDLSDEEAMRELAVTPH